MEMSKIGKELDEAQRAFNVWAKKLANFGPQAKKL